MIGKNVSSCLSGMMRKKKINDKILISFVTKLKQRFSSKIKKIILFGSRARGDNDPYSDYDLLIVCENLSEEIEKYVDDLENDILLSKFVLITAFLISEKEFEQRAYEPYLMNAKREGILV